ncbi:C2 calcium-dependent domain-containing protein 4A [Engraulis encrasicolus]|uniref:C2 calcium-dependent domain-containing protein 4A n=1 Tax=Engraulis encrasicolus TaxID=184585 RepID=UPI002FD36F5A
MWVVEKIRVSVERTNLPLPVSEYTFKIGDLMFGDKQAVAERTKKASLMCPNIITPDTIPEFCIPPKIPSMVVVVDPHKGGAVVEPLCKQAAVSSSSRPTAPACERGSPRRGEAAAAHHHHGPGTGREMVAHIIQVESVDDGPYDLNGCSDEETTNADPQSQAALSLPHMAKAQTCYGFCTLLESPHTRRKESLFHNDPSMHGIPLVLPRSRSNTYSHRSSGSTSPCLSPSPSSSPSPSPSSPTSSHFTLNGLSARLSPARAFATLHRQGTLDSDTTTSSTESSPFSSPLLAPRVPPPPPKCSLFKALSHERLLHRNLHRNHHNSKTSVSRNNSLSTDESSSTDNSPNVLRRASEGLVEPLTSSIAVPVSPGLGSASAPGSISSSSYGLAPPAIFPMDLLLPTRERALRETLVPVGRDGTLRLSAEYCPENLRLRVRLVSAEGLYSLAVDPKSINCSVSISLVPGKVQKQRSTVIRKSRNPIFNEDFFFDGIREEDLSLWALRFKVVNKMSTMKRDYVLGDCELPLNSIVNV